MRILFTADYMDPENLGGSGRVVAEIAALLVGAGHSVSILSGAPAGTPVDMQIRRLPGGPEVEWTTFPYPTCGGRSIDSFIRLAREVRRAKGRLFGRFDIVCHNQPLTAALFGQENAEQVYLFHSPWSEEVLAAAQGASGGTPGAWVRSNAAVRRWIERIPVRRASKVLVLSEYMKRFAMSLHGVPEERILVRPGGADPVRFSPAGSKARSRARARWNLDENDRVIVCVRRLIQRTGVDLVIDAVKKLQRERSDTKLLIAGLGPESHPLQQQAAALAPNSVEFLGYVPDEDLSDLYRAADLSVTPTRALEGFGLSTLESLACGTPVVATPVGGNVEILESLGSASSGRYRARDGQKPNAGLIAADVSSEALAASIQSVFDAPSEGRSALREACAAHATRYSWRNLASAIADLGVAPPPPTPIEPEPLTETVDTVET